MNHIKMASAIMLELWHCAIQMNHIKMASAIMLELWHCAIQMNHIKMAVEEKKSIFALLRYCVVFI